MRLNRSGRERGVPGDVLRCAAVKLTDPDH